MKTEQANAGMGEFIRGAIENDITDAKVAAISGGSTWRLRDPIEADDGVTWTQLGPSMMLADAADADISYLQLQCPELALRRLRAQRATLDEVIKIADPDTRYLLLIAMARAWVDCIGWKAEWDAVPIPKIDWHYADELSWAKERGMPEFEITNAVTAGGWL